VQKLLTFRDAYRRPRCIVPVKLLRVESDQGPEGQAALCHRHEVWEVVWYWQAVLNAKPFASWAIKCPKTPSPYTRCHEIRAPL
jgi:hypothetical protein